MKLSAMTLAAALVTWTSPAWAQIMPDRATLSNQPFVTGYVGSSFGDDVGEEHLDFGGSAGWMWRQTVGAEFLAGFAPDFSLLGGDVESTALNSYMANVIAAMPLGTDGRWQPFVSGGVGAITLRVDDDEFDIDAPDETEFGGNLGFGVMGFADRVGFRADLRYFTEMGGDITAGTGGSALTDLDFWRANAGIAFRW
jgi:hypothetical protein